MATPYKLITPDGEKITDIKSISNFTPADVERLIQYIIEKVEAFGDFSTPGLWNNISADARDLVSNWNNSVKTLWDALKESDPDALAALGLGSINIQDLLIGDATGTEAGNYLDPVPEENKLGQKYVEARHDEIKMNIKNMDYTNRELDSDGKPISPISSALNLLMPRYARRVEVEDLDKNFWVISAALDAALTSLFDPNGLVPSMLKEICEIWQNISNLWRLLSELITYMNNMFALLGLGDIDTVSPYVHEEADPRIGLYEITRLSDFDIQLKTSTGSSRIIKTPFRNYTFSEIATDDPRHYDLATYCTEMSGKQTINESQFFILAEAGAGDNNAEYINTSTINNLGQFSTAVDYRTFCINNPTYFFALPESFTIILYDPSFYSVKSDKSGLEFQSGKTHELTDEMLATFDKSNFGDYTVYLAHSSLFNGEILLQRFVHMHMQHCIPKLDTSYWTSFFPYFYKTSATSNDNLMQIMYVNKDMNDISQRKVFGKINELELVPLKVGAYWTRSNARTNDYVVYSVDYNNGEISTPNYFSTANTSDTRIVITSGPGYINQNAVGDNNVDNFTINGRIATRSDRAFNFDSSVSKKHVFTNNNGLKIQAIDGSEIAVSTNNIESAFFSNVYDSTDRNNKYYPAGYFNIKMRELPFLNQFRPTKAMIELETGRDEYHGTVSDLFVEGYFYSYDNNTRKLPDSLTNNFWTWHGEWENIPYSIDSVNEITWDTSSWSSTEPERLKTGIKNGLLQIDININTIAENKYCANFVVGLSSALSSTEIQTYRNYCRYGGFRLHGFTEAGCYAHLRNPLFNWDSQGV